MIYITPVVGDLLIKVSPYIKVYYCTLNTALNMINIFPGKVWKARKWIERSKQQCRDLEEELLGAHWVETHSQEDPSLLWWGI